MIRKIAGTAVGILLAVGAGVAPGQVGLEGEPGAMPPPIQVIQPKMEVLKHPVVLEVYVEPSLGIDTSMRILCATNTYRGEVHVERQDTSVQLSIAGEIKELEPDKFFVSFDVEGQSSDNVSGGKGFAGGGGAILEPAKSKTVLTIGGNSVMLTVRLAE